MPGLDRLPAVILVHGSGGVSGYVDDWAQWFNAMGIATFVFDSFTARDIVNTVYLNDDDVADNTIRIFHGAADDYVPVAPCRLYVERGATVGYNAQEHIEAQKALRELATTALKPR